MKIRLLLCLLAWVYMTPCFSKCSGRIINPITDICWSCMFPITLGGMTLMPGEDKVDPGNPKNPICVCTDSVIPRVGLAIGFWEPARLVDVTHTPYCFVSLGGMKVNMPGFARQGSQGFHDSKVRYSTYQVHWYMYPAIYILELLTNALCLEQGGFDLAYMSEFDPTWQDDELAFFLNPEAGLFANPTAQAACAADCLSSSTGGAPIDSLYWCAGCQGSMYPLSGYVTSHIGGVQASTLLAERFTFKLHREGLLWGSAGKQGLCGQYYMPIMKKSQYKLQMSYPVPGNSGMGKACNFYGRSTALWEWGREYPVTGEDFAYVVWRKRNCCAG